MSWTLKEAAGIRMRMMEYQALLTRVENVARVQEARRAIERVGGRVRMESANGGDLTVVVVRLPEQYALEAFLPGLPFYPT